ncbi:MAG: rRNA pseudouridine synthase [Oscillospiraceae bacterium]|jgi:23S rRNA pseudouridine2605 synthase|nr:rRNA pseudouridine synthase [Oscillospiraceae bacterium]
MVSSESQALRLQKYLAQRGVASRRKSEEMILAGRVKVDGRPAVLGQSVVPGKSVVTLDGKRLDETREAFVYIMLHKPRGFVTTMEDKHAAKSVAELVDNCGVRIFPVGRLDKDSEGLLLMTNDGDFAQALTHPSRHIPKIYRVTLRGEVMPERYIPLIDGMRLDGHQTAPIQLRELLVEPTRTVLEFTLHEGRNRQIRRMCESIGLEVLRLKRTAIGQLKLGMLQSGQWRELTKEEVARLKTGG